MHPARIATRPLGCLKSVLRHARAQRQRQSHFQQQCRTYYALDTSAAERFRRPPPDSDATLLPAKRKPTHKKIPVLPPLSTSARKACPVPIRTLTATQLATLDPTGARTHLFSKTNRDAAKPGDILLVRPAPPPPTSVTHKAIGASEPFAGVCLSIRRRGIDTAILLRSALTRVGVEMWFKIYSPLVAGIEVVQRRRKRARRARLYYMRLPKHDVGSVEGVVRAYEERRRVLGIAGTGAQGKKGGKGSEANARLRKSKDRNKR